jgi:hypothetical protein
VQLSGCENGVAHAFHLAARVADLRAANGPEIEGYTQECPRPAGRWDTLVPATGTSGAS